MKDLSGITAFLITLLFASACQIASPPSSPSPIPFTPSPVPEIGVGFVTRVPPTAAVIDVPTATPLPPPTATPTPTPIVYQIVEGDTILGIAIDSNTTTEDIMALNPGVRPELLQIGAELILPPPATPLFGGAVATAVPVDLAITQTHIYQTASDRSWVVGEILNEGPAWVTQVQLMVELFDPDGRSLGQTPAWTSGPLIAPGQNAPFGILWPGELPENVRPAVSVIRADGLVDPFTESGSQFLPLTAANLEQQLFDGEMTISGDIENPAADSAAVGEIIVTFYGQTGRLVGYATMRTPVVSAQTSLPFEIKSVPPGGRPADFKIYVHGIRP